MHISMVYELIHIVSILLFSILNVNTANQKRSLRYNNVSYILKLVQIHLTEKAKLGQHLISYNKNL